MNNPYAEDKLENALEKFHADPETGVTFSSIEETRIIDKYYVMEHMDSDLKATLLERVLDGKCIAEISEEIEKDFNLTLVNLLTEANNDF